MADAASESVLHGRPASPGLAIGPLVRLTERDGAAAREAEGEVAAAAKERLARAIARARAEIEAIAARSDEEGADILAFQIELLEDPALVGAAIARIDEGAGASTAWGSAVAEEVAAYRASGDELLAARATDLEDLAERVVAALDGASGGIEPEPLHEGAILVARDLPPSRFLALAARLGGIALAEGSPASHVAILARARGLPLVTGLGRLPEPGAMAVLDGSAGTLVASPDRTTLERADAQRDGLRASAARALASRALPALLASGQRIQLMLNLDRPEATAPDLLAAADGVGLFRTEFLFLGRPDLPDEEEQHAVYAGLLRLLGGRPCTVRTLDVGGDKPLPGVSLPAESNPFLGLRGLRLCLERPDLFRPQVRALLRAAVLPGLQVMLPMVTVAAELAEARAFFLACLAELRGEGRSAAMPSLGIMIEVPAAALAIDRLDADFYSIGSNDLVQYVMAASRDGTGRVAALNDGLHPAVLELIARTVAHGAGIGRPVSLCGDAGGDPGLLPSLLACGLRRFSVAPAAFDRVKAALADLALPVP